MQMLTVDFSVCALLLFCSQAATLVFILDAQTPPQLVHLITTSLSAAHHPAWVITDISNFFCIAASQTDVVGVIDGTFSVLQTETIEVVSAELDVPVLVLGYTNDRPKTPLSFHMRGNFPQVALAVEAILNHFTWSKVNLVLDKTEPSFYIASSLHKSGNLTFDSLVVGLPERQYIDQLVGRTLRLKGNRVSVFACSPEVAKQVLSAQYRKHIGGVGFGNVLTMESALYGIEEMTVATGNLILAEEGMEFISGLDEYYAEILSQAVRFYEDNADPSTVLSVLQKRYPGNVRPPAFSLVNMQQGTRVRVGSLTAWACQIFAPLYFLGNVTTVPTNSPSTIPVSANFGVRNAQSYHLSALTYYCGTVLAIADINERRDVLETFTLELYNFTAGVQVWDYQFAYENVFPNKDKLGLAVFASTSSALSIHLLGFLRSLNYTGPLVGASNTVNSLSSKEQFPGFIRTIVPDEANVAIYVQIFKRYGWKRCGIFVSNEIWGLAFREGFIAQAQSNGIDVVNLPEMQILPTPLTSIEVLRQNYTANFQDFIKTKARILLLVMNNNAVFVIDYLYELGMRKGELQVLACEMLFPSFISTSDSALAYGRSQLLEGAVQFSPVGYVGPLGTDVKQRLRNYTSEPPLYACFYYDAGLAVGYTFDLLIQLGEDYSDPSVFQRTIRGSNFVGCTGTVTFSSESNDRTAMEYGIFNARSNGTCITSIPQVGIYSPTSVDMFKFDQELVWNGGTTVPGDLRETVPGCSFEKKYDTPFPEGQHLMYQLFTAYFIYLFLICFLLCRYIWRHALEDLTSKQQFELLDAVRYWEIVLEMCQYIGLGPTPGYFPLFLRLFFSVFVLDLEHLPTLSLNKYELLIWSINGLCLLTLLVWVVLLFQTDQRCAQIPGCKALGDFAELTVWLLSDWLFLPTANVLFTVFVCVRCNGPADYRHSYLQADCQLTCWQGRHLAVAGTVAGLLLLYVPLAVAFRPLWQGLFQHINIKAWSRFLIYKSLYQISVVMLKTALKLIYPTWFSTVFLLCEGLFVLICLKVKVFAYYRAVLWQRCSLIGAFWTTVLTLLEGKMNALTLFGLWLGGLCLLAAVGGLYQCLRLPSLLHHQKGVNTMQLFRFAFQRSTLDQLSVLQASLSAVHRPSALQVPANYLPSAEDFTSDSLTRIPRIVTVT